VSEAKGTPLAGAADPHSGSGDKRQLVLRGLRQRAAARALAANPSTPPSLLWSLARFGQWDVKLAVAANPHCTGRVLAMLSFSRHWGVVAAVAANSSASPQLIGRLARRRDARIPMAAAANPALGSDVVAALLASPSVYVRGIAAAHQAAPADALRRLADGMNQPAWVLRAVAINPSCPSDLSDQLLTWITLGGLGGADPLFDPVRCTGNPADADISAMAWYAQQARDDAAYRHPLWRVRAMAAGAHQTVPLARLRELRRDPRPEVRRAVAGFIGVRPRDVREMAGDADPAVARIAARVRSKNFRRYLKRRLPRIAVRLVPLALFSGVLIFNSIIPSAKVPTPAIDTTAPNGVLFASCAPSPGWLTAVSRIATGDGAPSTGLGLPGGGLLACGPTSAEPESIFISAGSTGLDVQATGTVQLPDGKSYTNEPLHLAAGRNSVLYLVHGPSIAVVTITPDDTPAQAVAVTLSFSTSQP